MNRSYLTIVAAVAVACGSISSARAQYSGGQSTGGSSFGSSYGASSGSQGTFGSRSVGSGTIAAGNRTLTGSQPTNGQMNNLGNVGQLTGSERFLQSNRRGQFVGGNAQNAQALSQQLAGGQAGLNQNNVNSLLGGLGRNNRNNNANQLLQQQFQPNGMTNGQPGLRTVLKPDFDYPTPSPAKFNAELSARLTSLMKNRATSPIKATVQGRAVVLTGAVATEHDRVLAEKLATLEPGVGTVENELVVSPTKSSDLPSPK